MHAISKDPNAFEKNCLYCQVDSNENGDFVELRFVPADGSVLEDVFETFSNAATLNPDEELDGEGDFFMAEETITMPSAEEFEDMVGGQFEDAE